MALAISPTEALWFLPFVVPLCLWVMWSDLSAMRIPNVAVLTLAAIFLVVGLIALPWADYPWRDVGPLCFIFAANLLACFVTHRIAKHTALRRLAPNWTSWDRGRKFPMGFALGATLIAYLALGAAYGT